MLSNEILKDILLVSITKKVSENGDILVNIKSPLELEDMYAILSHVTDSIREKLKEVNPDCELIKEYADIENINDQENTLDIVYQSYEDRVNNMNQEIQKRENISGDKDLLRVDTVLTGTIIDPLKK